MDKELLQRTNSHKDRGQPQREHEYSSWAGVKSGKESASQIIKLEKCPQYTIVQYGSSSAVKSMADKPIGSSNFQICGN